MFLGLVAWHSGRTSVFDRRTFPVLRSTCNSLSSFRGRQMSSRLQLDVRSLSLGMRHLMIAYEVKAGIGVIAGNTVWSMPERLECEVLQNVQYINTLIFSIRSHSCPNPTTAVLILIGCIFSLKQELSPLRLQVTLCDPCLSRWAPWVWGTTKCLSLLT